MVGEERNAVARRCLGSRSAGRILKTEIGHPEIVVRVKRDAISSATYAAAKIWRTRINCAPGSKPAQLIAGAGVLVWRFGNVIVSNPDGTSLVDSEIGWAVQKIVLVLVAIEPSGNLQKEQPVCRALCQIRTVYRPLF